MESPPKPKLKPQKMGIIISITVYTVCFYIVLSVLSGPKKETPKDRSTEKQKLKPRRLPELQGKEMRIYVEFCKGK